MTSLKNISVSILMLFILATPAFSHAQSLFGSIEFKASSLNALPKWQQVLDKIYREKRNHALCDIDAVRCYDKDYATWRSFIKKTEKDSFPEKLNIVNKFVNKWSYKTDNVVWGQSDYWASPAEFIQNSGDCEDYAIMKFISLKDMGVSPESMRIVVVQDTIRRVPHAVLSVEYDGNYYILDSLIDRVVLHEEIRHYIPQYSVNEKYRWAHVMPLKKDALEENRK